MSESNLIGYSNGLFIGLCSAKSLAPICFFYYQNGEYYFGRVRANKGGHNGGLPSGLGLFYSPSNGFIIGEFSQGKLHGNFSWITTHNYRVIAEAYYGSPYGFCYIGFEAKNKWYTIF